MPTKTFEIDAEWDGHKGETILWQGTIELDQRILDAVDDDWRANIYSHLHTEQQIAEHIAYNVIVNNVLRVQDLDGWADQPEDVKFRIDW